MNEEDPRAEAPHQMPSVGRIVHIHHDSIDGPMAAVITKVKGQFSVNVHLIPDSEDFVNRDNEGHMMYRKDGNEVFWQNDVTHSTTDIAGVVTWRYPPRV